MPLSKKLARLFLFSSILPLLVVAMISSYWSYQASRRVIIQDLDRMARSAADRIDRHLTQQLNLLVALAQNIERVGLKSRQKEVIVKNYVLRFPAIRAITLVDPQGNTQVTSHIDKTVAGSLLKPSERATALAEKQPRIVDMRVDDDLIPTMKVTVPLIRRATAVGLLVAQLDSVYLWKMIESLHIGQAGYAMIVDRSHRLLAHGNPRGKALVLEEVNIAWGPNDRATGAFFGQDTVVNIWGQKVLRASSRVPATGWALVVEQPLVEALAGTRKIVGVVLLVALIILAASLWVGLRGRRRIVGSLEGLMVGVRQLAKGDFGHKVAVAGDDEFAQFAETFNRLGSALVQLQGELKKRERITTFGRVAAALAHDLKHPIQNLSLNGRLLAEKYNDEEFRSHFNAILNRELGSLQYMVDHLRELGRGAKQALTPVSIEQAVDASLQAMREKLEGCHIDVDWQPPQESLMVLGEPVALRRLFDNIVGNACEAIVADRKSTYTSGSSFPSYSS